MKAVNDDYHKQLSALQGNDKISLGEYKSQLAALHKTHREQVGNILTGEQKKMLADGRGKIKMGMQTRGTAALEKMKQSLNLTDEQVAKLKTQREQLHAKMQSVRGDSTLLPQQKREKMKEIFAAQKEQLKAVLTPDQFAKLQIMQKERMNRFRRADGDKTQSK
jgi:Spy/CpxP family protein refolding chaperone